ncbi:hypothetical protein B0T26DRAFT_235938 [Lasiosphaeria miniovina]|uniref:Uncharacterized protein n=1 Tax=Lasiosphaeria miniovina TaxID=1954250 RepID=A0AA40E544_9PEZI|nr:uncharacterized protein B0T26DRAFT_235938 [Lasiosphaeria miniovina]KAK0722823.1 hypothetical protein B0T26DRAFT_235938 [Lasiosphaeria miniovina]
MADPVPSSAGSGLGPGSGLRLEEAAARQIKEELVKLRMDFWKSNQIPIENTDQAANIAALGLDSSLVATPGNGCLVPVIGGWRVFVSFDDAAAAAGESVTREFDSRLSEMRCWAENPANGATLKEVEGLLDAEIEDKCFWEFLDGGDASRLSFYDKIKLCAQYRLEGSTIYPSVKDPRANQFKFGVCSIAEYGTTSTTWNYIDWSFTASEMEAMLKAMPRPRFRPQQFIPYQIQQLKSIDRPHYAAKSAWNMISRLAAQDLNAEPLNRLSYFFSRNESDPRPAVYGKMDQIQTLDDFEMIKQDARRSGAQPVLILVSVVFPNP